MRHASILLLAALILLLPLSALAEDALATETAAEAAEDGGNGEDGEDLPPDYEVEEVIVVTASRTEQHLHEVPAAMTVLTDTDLELIPSDDYGDVLRNVPGLNVSQLSARDINMTSRSSTNSLATGQLVLLDGRTLYLDFFGFVMWDFLPVNPKQLKQIEVVRGPGSAVWGANAMNGVVNLITKRPKEMAGTSVTVGGGELGTLLADVTHAGVSGKLGYRIAASYYEQDPYDRPTGLIPGTMTAYPPFENQGTEQPKLDIAFDYDISPATLWSISAGAAETDGIVHSGIGPFDVDDGSGLSYLKTDWTHQAMRLTFFANFLDGDAQNLLTVGPDGLPIPLAFESQTYNLDFSDTRVFGQNNIVTYGANVRSNSFDLSIAPEGDDRDELGVFLQDEILIGDKVRWLVGARVDDIDPIDTVFSPRTSLLISPTPNHTFRISANRAYRAPSLIENFLQIQIVNALPLPEPAGTFIFPTVVFGNPVLDEEELTAFEVGWTGTLGNRATVTLSVYRNELEDLTDFFPASFYSGQNPPPGWPLPPVFLDIPPLAGALPATFTYRNIGQIIDEGVELGVNQRLGGAWSWFLNASYQADPEVEGVPREEINTPPEYRANVGAAYSGERWFANAVINYQDEAFWTDVLDSRFWGPTDSFTMVNLGAGIHLPGDHVTLSVNGQNVFDEDVQQHVFGDIISRKVTGQLRFEF